MAQATTADVDFNRRSQDLGVRVVKHPKRAGERTLIATRDFQVNEREVMMI